MKVINERTGWSLKNTPELEGGQLYIYIMLNDAGKIKIGKTKNIYQRYQSLCGSNSQGNEIIRVYCSPATYLYTIETIMHEKFSEYRIPNTEWFYGDDLKFDDIVKALEAIFLMDSYKLANENRRRYVCKMS